MTHDGDDGAGADAGGGDAGGGGDWGSFSGFKKLSIKL